MIPLPIHLALADLRHNRLATLCQVVGLASLLLPLLILFGIRNGVVADRAEALLTNPEALRITVTRTGAYPAEQIDRFRADPDVAFVAPHPVSLAVRAAIARPEQGGAIVERATLLATGAGDPYLVDRLASPGPGEAVLSAVAAGALDLSAGMRAELLLEPRPAAPDGAIMGVTVIGVVPAAVWGRAGALLSEDDLFLVQDWTDGLAEGFDLDALRGTRAARESYPSMRLYARDADSAERIVTRLAADGVPTGGTPRTAADLVRLRRALDAGFVTVAAVATIGLATVLAASLATAVLRNRRSLGLLRLGGLSRAAALAIPLTQALAVGAAGWLLAILLYGAMTGLLSRLLAETFAVDGALTRLGAPEIVLSAALTAVVSAVGALWATASIVSISPEEGLSDAT